MAKFGSEYFKDNPQNKVESLDEIITNVPFKETRIVDENVSRETRSNLIKAVFENKAKSIVDKRKVKLYDEGDEVNTNALWTPYEFLHELLPEVYRRNGYARYVVSDAEGEEIQRGIDERRLKYNTDVETALRENEVTSIYDLEADKVEELQAERKDIENSEIFITQSEIEAFLLTNTHLNKDFYLKEITQDFETLKDKGLICYDVSERKWVYKYEYISGNLRAKRSDLFFNEEEIKANYLTDSQYAYQLKLIDDNLPIDCLITEAKTFNLFLSANSHFATDKDIVSITNADMQDWDGLVNEESLAGAFVEWLDYAKEQGIILPKEFKGMNQADVIEIYIYNKYPKSLKPKGYDTATLKKKRINDTDKALRIGQPLFDKFLNKGLTPQAKLKVSANWNARFNSFVLPKLFKTPVALTLARYFKKDVEFIPNPTQVQSVQYMVNAKSGLLAYGVGVGKTASSILNVSYVLDNNLASNPLFVVPKPTYAKWKQEIQGGIVTKFVVTYRDGEEILQDYFPTKRKANKFIKKYGGSVKEKNHFSKGLLPHLPPIVDLGNLGYEGFVKDNLKTYTRDEQRIIDGYVEGIKFVKSLKPDYIEIGKTKFIQDEESGVRSVPTFNGFAEEEQIRSYFPDFDLDELVSDYNSYQYRFLPNDKNIIIATKSETKKDPISFLLLGFTKKSKEIKGEVIDRAYEIYGLESTLKAIRYDLGTYNDFPANTIFIATFEALKYFGSEKRTEDNKDELESANSLYANIYKELSQGEPLDLALRGGKTGDAESMEEGLFGSPTKPKIFLKDLGVDYLVVDETHFFKKVFTNSKGRPKVVDNAYLGRSTPKYSKLSKGSPSSLGLSMYNVVRYIQHLSEERIFASTGRRPKLSYNVCHLTATPFTNTPIEVYSMMAITNIGFLKTAKFNYVEDFFDAFMRVEFALRFRAGKIVKEPVLMGYNNAPQMRNVISYVMDYKSGQDANIKRPDKFVLPNSDLGVNTILRPSNEQEELISDIKSYIRGRKTLADVCGEDATTEVSTDDMSDDELMDYLYQSDNESLVERFRDIEEFTENQRTALKNEVEKIRQLDEEVQEEDLDVNEQALYRFYKGMSFIKQATLSPYLLTCRKAKGDEPTYRQYIDSSPKLLYTLKAIKSTHDFEDANNIKRTGCVIYMDIAVDPSVIVPIGEPIGYTNQNAPVYNEYKKLSWNSGGFEKIKQYLVNVYGYRDNEIVLAKGNMSDADKEYSKNKFLSGGATVLIGSSTISTGVDLQNNASSLFLNSFDWNPTDNEQVSGRIHRQGNCRARVRIVYPMISDSIDPIIFQLLQEKTARINEIWDKEGVTSALNLEDFNPAQLQDALITDPDDRTEMWFERETESILDKISEAEQKREVLKNSAQTYDDYVNLKPLVVYVLIIIDAYKKYTTQQEGIEETNNRIQDVLDTDFEDVIKETKDKKGKVIKTEVVETADELQVKAVNKIKKDRYDYANDPEDRYIAEDYADKTDEEIFKKAYREIGRNGSWFSENVYNFSEINQFIRNTYSDWYYGNFLTEEQQETISEQKRVAEEQQFSLGNQIDTTKEIIDVKENELKEAVSNQRKQFLQNEIRELQNEVNRLTQLYEQQKDLVESAEFKLDNLVNGTNLEFSTSSWTFVPKFISSGNGWLLAYRDMRQKRRVLESWNLDPENINTARIEVINEISVMENRLSNLEGEKSAKREQFKIEYEQNRLISPSLEELVDQFSSKNDYFLGEDARMECFEIDTTPTVDDLPDAEIVEEEFEEEIEGGVKIIDITEKQLDFLNYVNISDHSTDGSGLVAWLQDDSDIFTQKQLNTIAKQLSKLGVLDYTPDEIINDRKISWVSINSDYQIEDSDVPDTGYRLINLTFEDEPIEDYYDENFVVGFDDEDEEIETEEIETEEIETEESELDGKIDEYLSDIEGYEILLAIIDDDNQREEYLSEIEGYLILMELEGADENVIEELKNKFEL